MNVLLWFTVDLRAQANAVLSRAAAMGSVLPLYIVDPKVWVSGDQTGRAYDFLAETLRDLREDLAVMGAPLVVRVGDTLTVLDRMARRHRCTTVAYKARSPHVEGPSLEWLKAWAAEAGVRLAPVASEDLAVDTPTPVLRPVPGVEPGALPLARSLRLAPDPCPHRQPGGRRRAESVLATHLARAPVAPLPLFVAAERRASRLSPYLAQGVLSSAEVRAAVRQARTDVPVPSRRQTGATLLRGLDERSRLLTDGSRPCRTDPVDSEAERLAAWCAGQTGLPFVDACQRYLAATGWLPDPARALVLAVACHHLRLDWRMAARHLAAMSTDYDPGLLWPLARRVALGDGRLPRIPDPVAAGLAMDPAGALIRAWVPELKPLPGSALHRPWRWDGARAFLGRRYPEPLVDPATATRAARLGAVEAGQLDLGSRCPR